MISRRLQKTILAGFAALSLLLSIAPTFAQPAPVPALPDTERRTSYSISASTCTCSVGFSLYGDSTDYQNWVEVFINGALIPASGNWTITSPSGSLSSLPRPITDAVLTFTAQQTGTVQIVGARRPRRTSQFSENAGVSARALNQALTDIISQNREIWDKTNDFTGRALISQPGVTLGLLPISSVCQNGFLGFDSTGLIPVCRSSSGTGNVNLPVVSGDLAMFTGTAGMLADSGAIPTTPSTKDYLAGTDFTAGTTTSLTLTSTPPSKNVVTVAFDGIWQSANTWSLSGAVVTFSAAIPTNTQVVEIKWSSSLNGVYGAVSSIQAGGQTLSGPVQMSAGNGIGLTVSGQNIAISVPSALALLTAGSGISITGTTNATISQKSVYDVTSAAYGATANYAATSGAAMASGSATITSLGGLTSGNVGNYIAVAGAGSGGSTLYTTIASITNSTTAVLASGNASGGAISGKIAEWGTDQASEFQAAWNACVSGGGGKVYAPSGEYFISQLNMTGASSSCVLEGDGPDATRLFPLQVAAYSTTHGHMFDMTGSAFIGLRNLQIGANYTLALPATAIFMAQVASNVSNRMFLEHLYVSGQYAYTAFYDYGVPSLYMIYDSDFYNYYNGGPGNGALYLTATNALSLTSGFATVTTGQLSTSDIMFAQCEFHKFNSSSYDVIYLDTVSNVSWFSGVISGGAQYYVSLAGALGTMTFRNVTFETESQPEPTYAYGINSGVTITSLDDVGSLYVTTSGKFSASVTSNTTVNYSH